MIYASDIGYGYTKSYNVLADGESHNTFSPSATIPLPSIGFKLDQELVGVRVDGKPYLVGSQVRLLFPTDRDHQLTNDWFRTPEWMALFLTSASILFPRGGSVRVCTGLPIRDMTDENKAFLRERIQSVTQIVPLSGDVIPIEFETVRVVPQPWGTFLSLVFNADGSLRDGDLFNKRVLVIDVGSRTTNILTTVGKVTIQDESGTMLEGLWDCAHKLQAWATDKGHGITAAQAMGALDDGRYEWAGSTHKCSGAVNEIFDGFAGRVATSVAARAGSDLGQVGMIVISGGGGAALNGRLQDLLKHDNKIIAPQSFWANARGYRNFMQFLVARGEI